MASDDALGSMFVLKATSIVVVRVMGPQRAMTSAVPRPAGGRSRATSNAPVSSAVEKPTLVPATSTTTASRGAHPVPEAMILPPGGLDGVLTRRAPRSGMVEGGTVGAGRVVVVDVVVVGEIVVGNAAEVVVVAIAVGSALVVAGVRVVGAEAGAVGGMRSLQRRPWSRWWWGGGGQMSTQVPSWSAGRTSKEEAVPPSWGSCWWARPAAAAGWRW